MKESSVDFICTDPPYGYSFMGKDWDKGLPDKDVFCEMLLLKKMTAEILADIFHLTHGGRRTKNEMR